MDIYGIVIFIVGVIGFFIFRKRSQNGAIFFTFVSGLGAGLVIGAIWAVLIVNRTLGG
jgi:hypothetical protein